MCHQNIQCGQFHVQYRHTLKSIIKELNERIAKLSSMFFGT